MAMLFCYIAWAAGPESTATEANFETGQAGSERRVVEQLPAADWGDNLSGPLCGVYAACNAVELIGLNADPRNFIAAQYVGKCGGSSPDELARVVNDSGASACILSRLSAFDLRLIDCPVIANVRMSPTSNRFNHWVVAVPSDAGVTIIDGLQKPYEVGTAEFLGIWSGVGICVSRHDSNPLLSIWLGRISLFLAALIVCVPILKMLRALELHASMCKQLIGLCAASLMLAMVGNAAFGDLLNHRKGVAVATAAIQGGRYRIGTLDHATKASTSSDILLIDARREQDYKYGTIKGAVNIPVTASIWAIDKYLQKLDRRTPLVVFCQSAKCDYDETIGAQLVSLGFSDVTVCDEGWSEYNKKKLAGVVTRDTPGK